MTAWPKSSIKAQRDTLIEQLGRKQGYAPGVISRMLQAANTQICQRIIYGQSEGANHQRNILMRMDRKKGMTFIKIGKKYALSPTMVSLALIKLNYFYNRKNKLQEERARVRNGSIVSSNEVLQGLLDFLMLQIEFELEGSWRHSRHGKFPEGWEVKLASRHKTDKEFRLNFYPPTDSNESNRHFIITVEEQS